MTKGSLSDILLKAIAKRQRAGPSPFLKMLSLLGSGATSVQAKEDKLYHIFVTFFN